MRYRLTEAAHGDIREIVTHIRDGQQSPQNARLVATRLRDHFRLLAKHPGIGHVREELNDDSVLVSSVTGLFVIDDPASGPMTIPRVIHPARRLTEIAPHNR